MSGSHDIEGILRSIREEPEDDGLRLIAADWYEDNGFVRRAEHIRIGVRIGDSPHLFCDSHNRRLCRGETISRQEDCQGCTGEGLALAVLCHAEAETIRLPGCYPIYLAVGGYMRHSPLDHVWGRVVGFVRRGFLDEIRCDSGYWSAHGETICAEHPVCRVLLTDKMPRNVGTHGDNWVFVRSDECRPAATPAGLFAAARRPLQDFDGQLFKKWLTQREADDALSDALLRIAKGES